MHQPYLGERRHPALTVQTLTGHEYLRAAINVVRTVSCLQPQHNQSLMRRRAELACGQHIASPLRDEVLRADRGNPDARAARANEDDDQRARSIYDLTTTPHVVSLFQQVVDHKPYVKAGKQQTPAIFQQQSKNRGHTSAAPEPSPKPGPCDTGGGRRHGGSDGAGPALGGRPRHNRPEDAP